MSAARHSTLLAAELLSGQFAPLLLLSGPFPVGILLAVGLLASFLLALPTGGPVALLALLSAPSSLAL